jgi:uncharacterized protein YdaU (DUF1376 family)
MSSAPYFKLYFSDLAGDTLGLSDAEIGSYILLLGAMWNAGGGLANDPAELGRIARVTPAKWPGRWAKLARFFVADDVEITHKRLKIEREKAAGISTERSSAGRRGAAAKARKTKRTAKANATNADQQTAQQNPSIPDTIEEREESKDPSLSGRESKAGSESSIPEGFPDAAAIAEAQGWIEAAGVVLSATAHASRFRNHALTNDRDVPNWPAAWRAWIGIQIETAPKVTDAAPSAAAPLRSFPGPAELRAAVVKAKGNGWAISWLDPCDWDEAERLVIPANPVAAKRLRDEVGQLLASAEIHIAEPRARTAA